MGKKIRGNKIRWEKSAAILQRAVCTPLLRTNKFYDVDICNLRKYKMQFRGERGREENLRKLNLLGQICHQIKVCSLCAITFLIPTQ